MPTFPVQPTTPPTTPPTTRPRADDRTAPAAALASLAAVYRGLRHRSRAGWQRLGRLERALVLAAPVIAGLQLGALVQACDEARRKGELMRAQLQADARTAALVATALLPSGTGVR